MTVPGERTGSAWPGEPHLAGEDGRVDDAGVRGRLVAAAVRIGGRLAADAVWAGSGCTWPITRPAPDGQEPATIQELAPGVLYEGTAGIALFLAELHRIHPDPGIARAARGALDFALHDAASLPDDSFGLYNGRVGVAYTAVRAGRLLGIPFRERAEALLRPLAGNEHRAGMDALGGAAGAIPALLRLSHHLSAGLTLDVARRLGEHLRATANRGGDGWSWGASVASARALCGYSHGASGMAHAFLELYHHTGDGEYRYAAEQALLYESGFLSREHGSWPDFRTRGFGDVLTATPEELRERLRAPDPEPSYKCYWCHGAAGIGLVRLRAWRLLRDARYEEEARIAIRTARATMGDLPLNYSLCHGVAGNCETLIMGAEVLGDDALRAEATEWALRGIEWHEDAGQPWPSGALDAVPEPGLLLGDAGIGLFLLRLADPAIESVLLVTTPEPASHPGATGQAGYEAARAAAVDEHFGRTLERFRGMGIDVDPIPILPRPADDAPPRSHVAAAFDAIRERIAAEADEARRAWMEDAFRLERTRYELLGSVTNFTREHVELAGRRTAEEVDFDAARFVLSPRARLVETAYDWDSWRPGTPPEPGDGAWLLNRMGVRITVRELAPLPAAVLRALARPASLDELTASLADALADDAGDADRQWLTDRVRDQLVSAYRAALVFEAA